MFLLEFLQGFSQKLLLQFRRISQDYFLEIPADIALKIPLGGIFYNIFQKFHNKKHWQNTWKNLERRRKFLDFSSKFGVISGAIPGMNARKNTRRTCKWNFWFHRLSDKQRGFFFRVGFTGIARCFSQFQKVFEEVLKVLQSVSKEFRGFQRVSNGF